MNEGNSGDEKANVAEQDDKNDIINGILSSIGLRLTDNNITLLNLPKELNNINFNELLVIFDRYDENTLKDMYDEISVHKDNVNNLAEKDHELVESIKKMLEYDIRNVDIFSNLLKQLYLLQIKVIIFNCRKFLQDKDKSGYINELFTNITKVLTNKLEALNKLFDAKMNQYNSGEQKREAQELPISQQEVLPEQSQAGGAAKYYKDKYKYMKYKMKYMELKNKL